MSTTNMISWQNNTKELESVRGKKDGLTFLYILWMVFGDFGLPNSELLVNPARGDVPDLFLRSQNHLQNVLS